MNNQRILKLTEKYVARTYARFPVALVRGKGTRVWDANGKEYLDFVAGIAVVSLGHSHPAVVRAIERQARKLIHVSNLYHIAPQSELARELCRHSFANRVFFCNSGAEANEAAIKLARRYGGERLGGKYEVLSVHNSFHGRTLATLTATGQEKVRAGYDPLPPGFRQVPFNDLRSMEEAIDERTTAAILVEPIQGEGGYVVPPKRFLKELSELADAFGILMVVDEIQTGMGRTGKMFASEHFNLLPDIMTLAKGLASGLPLGAMIAKRSLMTWEPGAHANTFGGNPIACEAALATIDLLEDGLIQNAEKVGGLILARLRAMQKAHRLIGDVRGLGLMIGIDLVRDRETKEMAIPERNKIIQRCFEKGLLILGCGQNVIRFMPPLPIRPAEAETALSIFEEVLTEVERERTPR